MSAQDTAPNLACPSCGGKKQVFAFQNTGEDYRQHRQGYIDCITCDGSGELTAEHAQRIEEGRKLRKARIARGETLMDASLRLGLTPARLSAIECGREEKEMKP